jgi:uncharacterized damage-inducible protein DinB
MANEAALILKMFQNNWDGKMWYGGNIMYALKGISADKAFEKKPSQAHNVYELVMHMICWRKFVAEYLKGNVEYKVEINSELDWPVNYEPSPQAWELALRTLEKLQLELVELMPNVTDQQLTEFVAGKKFTWYDFLHGLLHHDIYHSGQIAVLKK